MHGHHCQSPCLWSPTDPLHFPAVATAPAAALSLNRDHLPVAGRPCHHCCTHCHSSICSKEMRDHLLPPGYCDRELQQDGAEEMAGDTPVPFTQSCLHFLSSCISPVSLSNQRGLEHRLQVPHWTEGFREFSHGLAR